MHVSTSRKGDSVKALLEGLAGLAVTRISDQVARQRQWRSWLESRLPAPAFSHVSGLIERADTLVVLTESAGWSARIRYAVAEIEGELRREHPRIRQVLVKVMPRAAK